MDEFDELDDEVDEGEESESKATPKQLRDAAKRAAKNAERAEKAERELAFLKAGVDTESALGKLIVEGYKGELTTEAIKAFVGELPQAKTDTNEEQQLDEGEDKSTEERQTLASGAAGDDGSGGLTTKQKAKAALEAARAAGKPEDDQLADWFITMATGATEGDTSVLVP